jgi:hypothetical protein
MTNTLSKAPNFVQGSPRSRIGTQRYYKFSQVLKSSVINPFQVSNVERLWVHRDPTFEVYWFQVSSHVVTQKNHIILIRNYFLWVNPSSHC